jgi:hypothetical protein
MKINDIILDKLTKEECKVVSVCEDFVEIDNDWLYGLRLRTEIEPIETSN